MKTLQLFRSSLSRLAAVLFFGIVAFPADTWAETFTVGSLNYETNADGDNTVTVTGHVGDTNPTGTLTIPGSVDYGGITYTVTQIGDAAFNSCSAVTGQRCPDHRRHACGHRPRPAAAARRLCLECRPA